MSNAGANVTPEQPFARNSEVLSEATGPNEPRIDAPGLHETAPVEPRKMVYRSPPRTNTASENRLPQSRETSAARSQYPEVNAARKNAYPEKPRTADHAVPSVASATEEVFDAPQSKNKTFTRFTPTGRLRRAPQPFAQDVTVGKFGVLAASEAEALEEKLLKSFAHDGFFLEAKSAAFKESFLSTLHLFLAINSGSIGNVTGRMGVRDDSQPLRFGDVELAAADVAAILGDRAYSYMRCRATVIRDTIEAAISTSNLPDAEEQFPGVCAAVDLIKVVAASKGLSQYPQYVAVGSQYAAGTPPYLITAILDSAAKVLNTTQTNVRQSEVVGTGLHGN